jgi:magnesium chelatase subunit I
MHDDPLHPVYPFSALVGQESMKQALVCAVINPSLHGVLVRGERGTAKSTAARAMARLLPPQQVVRGCGFGCDPASPACPDCRARLEAHETLEAVERPVPFVSLPVSATEDRVVGTLDLEQAVLKGRQRFSPGVLAEANRGVLYIDEVNLLPDHVMDLLLDAAAMGVNRVERESISFSHPSRFLLVGTMNPEEGELRPQLTDRFDLSLMVGGERALEKRRAILERGLAFEADPARFVGQWREAEALLADQVVGARRRLASVQMPDWVLDELCQTSNELAVDGHRAELAALKVVGALAALEDRPVDETMVARGVELAYTHRLRRRPFEEESDGAEKLDHVVERLREASPSTRTSRRASPGLPPGKKKD